MKSQVQKVIELLKKNPGQRFTALGSAKQIVEVDPDDYQEKRQNPRFANDNAFISQIVSEIGAHKKQLATREPQISWQDKPRPRVFWYDPDNTINQIEIVEEDDKIPVLSFSPNLLSEHDLYPILINYLKSELNLYCLRIDERRSSNSRGSGGNHWLHP